MYKLFFLLFVVFSISACKEEITEETVLQKLEREGKIPTYEELDRTDTIEGIDANGDGIRDDIERWIEKKYPLQIPEARQLARAFQQSLIVDENNIHAVKQAFYQENRASECLIIVKGDEQPNFVNVSKIFDELNAITTNTKKRLIKDLKISQALNGQYLKGYDGENACDE